jgi:hypothetical protein
MLMGLSAMNLGFLDFVQLSDSKKPFVYDSFHFSDREAQVVSLMLKGH